MADTFRSHLEWSGAAAGPTRNTETFSRNLDVSFDATTLLMSAAPSFHGDPFRANPEQLFVASVSSCHALTYLYLCARKGIAVVGYTDDAVGTLEVIDGRMQMTQVLLRPHITLECGSNETEARHLIDRAHRQCFIANSVSAPIAIIPTFETIEPGALAGAGRTAVDESC